MPTECLFCHKLTQLDQLPPDEIVWKFPYSIAFLGPWQYYHGYCILVYRFHATELSQLGVEDRLNFLDELCILAKAIEDSVHPKKMNYEMLGNQTPHMHWHLIPRFKDDPDAKHPIWFMIEKVKNDKPERQKLRKGPESSQRIIESLQHRLKEAGAPSEP